MSALFFLLVAAYSAADRDLIAALGRYRSPVAFFPCVEGLPLFVRHFCFVQFFRLFWLFFNANLNVLSFVPFLIDRYSYKGEY